MALSPGTTLGPYEIQAPLGAGGMGEVYKARDTRLDWTAPLPSLTKAGVDFDEPRGVAVEADAGTLVETLNRSRCTFLN